MKKITAALALATLALIAYSGYSTAQADDPPRDYAVGRVIEIGAYTGALKATGRSEVLPSGTTRLGTRYSHTYPGTIYQKPIDYTLDQSTTLQCALLSVNGGEATLAVDAYAAHQLHSGDVVTVCLGSPATQQVRVTGTGNVTASYLSR